MKIKKIIIIVLLLLIPTQIAGCNKVAQEVEKATPAPVAMELTGEEYIADMIDSLGKTSDGFQKVTVLLKESKKDSNWEAKMNTELEGIRAASLGYLDLKNIPEKYSKVHEHVTQAMLNNILAVDSYPVKAADRTTKSFTTTVDYMKEGAVSIGKAMEELDKVK